MIDLIFDTETTGFARFNDPWEHPDQPHIVQIAARLVEDGKLYAAFQTVVNCMVESTEGALKVHKITKETCDRVGMLPSTVAYTFGSLAARADRLVAHNMKFDIILVGALLHRAREFETASRLLSKPKFCTMQALTPIMKIPSKRGGYKWPKLIEAYKEFIDPAGFEGAHDAMADVIACEKVFNYCKSIGLVPTDDDCRPLSPGMAV